MNLLKTVLLAALVTPVALDAQQLQMRYDGTTLSVDGGRAGDVLGIVLGITERPFELPNGGTLYIEPTDVIVLGRMDGNGSYRLAIGASNEPGDPATFFAQAITLGDDGVFRTSSLKVIDFDGQRFEMRNQGGMAAATTIRGGSMREETAWRRGAVA